MITILLQLPTIFILNSISPILYLRARRLHLASPEKLMRKSIFLRRKSPCKKTFQGLDNILCCLISAEKVANSVFKEELLTSKVLCSQVNNVDTVIMSKRQAIPGPGSYEPKVTIDKFGIYHLSNIP